MGEVADRWGRRGAFRGFAACYAVTTIVMAMQNSAVAIDAVRLIDAIAIGAQLITLTLMVRDSSTQSSWTRVCALLCNYSNGGSCTRSSGLAPCAARSSACSGVEVGYADRRRGFVRSFCVIPLSVELTHTHASPIRETTAPGEPGFTFVMLIPK